MIDPKTQNALNEMGKAAAKALNIEGEIIMTACHERNYEWCGLTDGDDLEAEQTEECELCGEDCDCFDDDRLVISNEDDF